MTLARSFWSLVILVLVMMIVASAAAIWFTATPFLTAMQQRMIADQVEQDARAFDAVLAEHRQLLSFVASQPDVVSVAIGYVSNTDVMRDYLEAMPRPDTLENVILFDAFGEELARMAFENGHHSTFSNEDLEAVQKVIMTGGDPELEGLDAAAPVLLKAGKDYDHIAIGVPVVNRGHNEGTLIAEFDLHLDTVFQRNEIARLTTVVPAKNAAATLNQYPGARMKPVAGGALSLVLVPDSEAVAAAGQDLLIRSVGAISVVLIFAFSFFASLGRAVILTPHERLARQKKELDELAAVARNANDAILVTDLDERVVWGNPAFEAMSGYRIDEVRGHKPGSFLQNAETDPETAAKLQRAIRMKVPVKAEILNTTRNGNSYWISISITPLLNGESEVYGFMAISSDITRTRKQREEIEAANRATEYQARHDPLTGLANRRVLSDTLDARVASDTPNGTLLRIDLDHFKYINDTMGHSAGDFALAEVADILRDEIGADDLAVQVGGDEFIVMLRAGGTTEQAVETGTRILENLRTPRYFERKPIQLGASFGVASTECAHCAIDNLVVCADAALYTAKDQGRNRIIVYDTELHEEVLFRRELAAQMRGAIKNEEFEPFFQPQIDATTGEIYGVEALARWPSPKLGMIFPDTFLPVARQLSLVEDIDDIIFRKGIRYINELAREGVQIPKISFNVTSERVLRLGFGNTLKHVGEYGPRISFEILESVLVEEQSDQFKFALDALREKGFSIEVDDFGSGHASIVALTQLQPDVMKIDRQLVMPILESETSAALLRSIVDMAKVVDVQVTVEGVETREHVRIVTEMGCDYLQGYYFAKPLSRGALKDFAHDHQPGNLVGKKHDNRFRTITG